MDDKDREHQRALKEAEHLHHLIIGDGWAVADRLLREKEEALADLSSIPMDLSVADYGFEAKARAYALSLIASWRRDIDTRVSLYEASLPKPGSQSEPIVINREE